MRNYFFIILTLLVISCKGPSEEQMGAMEIDANLEAPMSKEIFYKEFLEASYLERLEANDLLDKIQKSEDSITKKPEFLLFKKQVISLDIALQEHIVSDNEYRYKYTIQFQNSQTLKNDSLKGIWIITEKNEIVDGQQTNRVNIIW